MNDQLKVLMIVLVQKKKHNINFSKAKTKFYLSLHYNGDERTLRNSMLLVLAWVAYLRGWRASVGNMGGMLALVAC